MTRVTGADHVLLLLRERLRRGEGIRPGKAGSDHAARSEGRPLDRMRASTAFEALGDEERRRAVVQGLLIEEFGDAVGNDPAFHAVLDRVMRMLAEAPGGTEMIDRATAALKVG